MQITQVSPDVEILPEDVNHGDIIKFKSKDERTGIITEKSGTVQFILFNPRTNSYLFYTEDFREGYDNEKYLLGDGFRDTLTKLGHVVSPLDSAEVGDRFEVSRTKYIRNEIIEKLENGWWISRFKINNKAEGREVYSESEARHWFRENSSTLIKANVEKTADGKVVSFSKGDRVRLTPTALDHDAFRGFEANREYDVYRVVGQTVEMYPVSIMSTTRYTVHESHLMKVSK